MQVNKLSKYIKIFFIGSLIFIVADLLYIFVMTPEETTMGIVQKIFYIHVPSAFNMYIGFGIGFIFSILYLSKRKEIFDLVAYSAIEVGFVFASCVLISGPLWAKGAWGRFWDFDPRLTSTLIIWFIYFSYLILRKYYGDMSKGKLFSAIVAVIGFIDVPLIHYSVKLWRGIHPNVLTMQPSQGLPASMLHTLIFSIFSFLIFYIFIFLLKLNCEIKLQEKRGAN